MSTRASASAPFASRELNGEVLLDELAELRGAQVSQRVLEEVVRALEALRGLGPIEASAALKHLGAGSFAGTPAVGAVLARWAPKLKSEADVAALLGHFSRLAVVGALVGAFRRGADRLPRSVTP